MGVKADTTKAKAEIDEAARDRDAKIKPEVDRPAADKAKEEIDRTARDRKSKIKVEVDQAGLSRVRELLMSGDTGQASVLNNLLRARRDLSQGSFKDPFDLNDAIVKVQTLDQAFQKAGASMVSEAGSVGGEVGSAIGGPLTAGLIAAGVAGLAGIASAASGALGLIPAALAGAGATIGTLAIGLDGVKDAWEAAGKASQSAGQEQQTQAREVASAQRELSRAVQDEGNAQKDVANARKEARQQLEDLNLQLRGGALDEKQAALDAQAARRDLTTGRFRDSIEYEQAVLRVQQADQRVAEARQRNTETAQKANDANAKGVENADNVVAANQRLANAQEQITTAQGNLQQANTKVSSTAQDAANAMAKLSPAGQALVNTMLALKPVWQDFEKSIQQALLAGLGPQIQQLATTYLPMLQGSLTTMAGLINQAFSQFAAFLQQPATLATIQTILNNVNASFQAFLPTIQTLTQAFLQLTAVGTSFLPQLGSLINQIAQGFSQFVNSGALGQWIQVGIQAFQQFTPIAFQVLEIFRELSPIGTAALNAIGQAITGLMPVVQPLSEAFAGLLNVLAPILRYAGGEFAAVFGALAQALTQVFTALAPVTSQLSAVFTPAVAQIAPILARAAAILGGALAQAIQQIAPLIGPLAQKWAQMVVAVAPLLPALAQLAVQIIPLLTEAAKVFLPILTKLLELFTQSAGTTIPATVGALTTLARVAQTSFNAVKDGLTTMWNIIKPILETLKNLLDDIGGPLAKVADAASRLLGLGPGKTGEIVPGPAGAPAAAGGALALPGLAPQRGIGSSFRGLTPTQWERSTGLSPFAPASAAVPTGLPSGFRQVGSDQGLQPATVVVKGQLASAFPNVTDIGGWRPPDGYNEHSSGQAIDVMVPNWNKPEGVDEGNRIAQQALQNPSVDYVLWQQRQWNSDGTSTPMEDRGSPTQNHMDHVHVHTRTGASAAQASGGVPTSASVGPAPSAALSSTLGSKSAGGTPLGALSGTSSRDQIASAIVGEAQRRGFTREQTIAVLATALQESNLDPNAAGGGGAWHGIFQQDSGYPGRDNPATNISGFFDRLGAPQGDIWSQIFALQQGTPLGSPNARTGYLSEIQSKTGPATEMVDRLLGRTDPALGANPQGTQQNPMYVDYGPNSSFGKSSGAQQLGQDFVSGILQVFGFDGSLFKDPTSFGAFKGFKGLIGALTGGGKGLPASAYGGDGASQFNPQGGGGGDLVGGVLGQLLGVQPQPVGNLAVGGPGQAPGEFMPLMPGSQPSGLLQSPFAGTPGPGNNVQDNSINIVNPIGQDHLQQMIAAATPANLDRQRQGLRPLP